jgi:hypothetical protein
MDDDVLMDDNCDASNHDEGHDSRDLDHDQLIVFGKYDADSIGCYQSFENDWWTVCL